MRLLGFEITRVAKAAQALNPIPAFRYGWRVISEAFAGAWQRNIDETQGTVLCYPTLYACLNRISQDIGKLPFLLKRVDDNGIWRVDTANTAFWPVLRKPNNYQTAQQFRESWILSKLIQGNTYGLLMRDARDVVVRIFILDPCRVLPLVADNGDVYYRLNYSTGQNLLPENYGAEEITVPARDIIHDRLNTFHHPLIGVPPLCAAYWPAVKNLKILKDATKFFSNGANPGGLLTGPAGLGDDDAEVIKKYWNENFTGDNAGKVAVIGADMKFTPFAFKAIDSQLVEQMKYSDEQICQPFGIHPFIVGVGSIPAGLKVDDITNMYYQFALQAHIESMENLLDDGLAIARPLGVELDLGPLLRMDFAKRAEVMGKLTTDGIATPNEARYEFGYAPLTGGDTVYMQQQDYPLDQVRLNTIAPPAPPPAEPTDPPQEDDPPEADSSAEEVKKLAAELFLFRAVQAARTEAMPQ